MRRLEAIPRVSPLLTAATGLLLAVALAACGPSGPATTVNQPTGTSQNASAYTGPAPASKDVQAFEVALWNNIRTPRIVVAAATTPADSRRSSPVPIT